MPTSYPTSYSLPDFGDSQIINTSSPLVSLPRTLKKFYRHGWQSWTLTTWLDPQEPPIPIRAAEFRIKDEDLQYALHTNHVGAWVGAVELGEDDIFLMGALDLGGRVELSDTSIRGVYETAEQDGQSIASTEWFLARGREDLVFSEYAERIARKLGKGRFSAPPRVWCSWYSLYSWVNEHVFLKALTDFGDMPFEVFQLDDGWQLAHGDWVPNKKFPSGMRSLAEKILETGRTPGIWIAPFMVSPASQLAKDHPEWLLRDEHGNLIRGGITWNGNHLCLDVAHPEVLAWLDQLIRKVRDWGYGYLKLDFLYIGALPGKRYHDIPREVAYRNAMQIMREAAGDAYILACGAPVLPSLGFCDGIRIGPDVSPYWLNKPLTVWLQNPNDTSTQNAIRTSLHRLWLKPLVNVDPDVMFFRSRYNRLQPCENQLLEDLGTITGFKATSDLPQWMSAADMERLRYFLESTPIVYQTSRYGFQIDGRAVDFSPAVPVPSSDKQVPIWLARNLGLLTVAARQALPAMIESARSYGHALQNE